MNFYDVLWFARVIRHLKSRLQAKISVDILNAEWFLVYEGGCSVSRVIPRIAF